MLENTMPETELVYVLAKGAGIILVEPKPCVRQQYVLTAKKALLHYKKVMKEHIKYFKNQQEGAFEKINKCSHTAAIAQVAVHRLIVKALWIRKQYVGLLLKAVKHVCGLHCILYIVNLTIMNYFEHKRSVFVVDSCGRCCQDIEVHDDSTDKSVYQV